MHEAPPEYQARHPVLVSELRNLTHWPKHVLVHYTFHTHNDVDFDRGLMLLFPVCEYGSWTRVVRGCMCIIPARGRVFSNRHQVDVASWDVTHGAPGGYLWHQRRAVATVFSRPGWDGGTVSAWAVGLQPQSSSIACRHCPPLPASPVHHNASRGTLPCWPCPAGLLVFVLLCINALRGLQPKLAQFLADVTAETDAGATLTSLWKGGGKGE